MYCKHCGSVIDDNGAFCPNCGKPTKDEQETQGSTQGAQGTQSAWTPKTFCMKCGREINPTDNVCPNCGKPIPHPNGAPYGQPAGYAPIERKSKIAAGLLGIFLGEFGVHNFYLGYTGKAVAQLLITLCTCGVGATVTWIWGLIEGIMILTGTISTDGKGLPLGD
jgi:TM2 domain-containing membrane protein YozV/RNA polymerase subunit RPABC4/transcription elongation factor Spt4